VALITTPRAHFGLAPGHAVHQPRADDLSRFVQQHIPRRHVVDRHAAGPHRLADHAQGQAGIVGLGVAIPEATLQALGGDVRGKHLEFLGAKAAVGPLEGHQIVQGEARPVGPLAGMVAAMGRHQETQRVDQAGAVLQQVLALPDGGQGQAQLALGQVAQPAVDELR
jgi:hypothetical protein